MARRRVVPNWTGAKREDHLDGMFAAMQTQAQHELGSEVSVGTDVDAYPVGLPLSALSLRYLFQSTVFPLSRILQLVGEEGSAKSALMYEMFRWHLLYGGGAVFTENEGKDAPEMRAAMYGWNPAFLRRTHIHRTYSLEQWQDVLTRTMRITRQQQDHADGPGRTVPIAWGIDSIMGTSPQAELDSVAKDGHSSRGHALAALLIARYMRSVPDQLRGYPFTIIGTNHLKPATDFQGRPISNIPGGKAVKFMETYEIETKRAPNCDIDLLEYGGLRLNLTAKKCSLGPSRRHIRADLLWWQQPDAQGILRQHMCWDWDTATIELLMRFETDKGKKTLYNQLRQIVDINVVSKTSRMCWSDVLGIPRDTPVPYRQAGATLEQRPELLGQIYPLLYITPRRMFQPGLDYREMLATAHEQNAAASPVYTTPAAMPLLAGTEDVDEDSSDTLAPEEG